MSKKDQKIYVYENGAFWNSAKVSTGSQGHATPDFDKKPDGRMYKKYSSKKYPGGNYKGLGNMPYVIFIEGGIALHGTPTGNYKKLGQQASHGCIRVHSNNGEIIYNLVTHYGIKNTWITVAND